ncbi:MAG: MaoC family dehydratase N-terminal domain-containing protein [Burkholderiales bacterium]|nr:MaoC family dehydratase N-terminal domain-containing protein [Burkholderiales bacterium]
MILTEFDSVNLGSWVGRQETCQDTITAAPVRLMSALLGRDDTLQAGDSLPPLWHWLYFLPAAKASDMAEDGHPKRGGFLPPVPLPRRMWAGGSLEFLAPILVGDVLTRTSRIQSITPKKGRGGDLVFVCVEHLYHGTQGLCLSETHDIVYRSMPAATDKPLPPIGAHVMVETGNGEAEVWSRDAVPDEVLLFRYSALTFNAHRIHYDRNYASEVEGYPGLVVHGPLMATLLLDLLRSHTDRVVKRFSFKAVRPIFECQDQRRMRLNAQMSIDAKRCRLWAQDQDDWLTMQADAELA